MDTAVKGIALALTPGVGGATLKHLLDEHLSVEGIWGAVSGATGNSILTRMRSHIDNGGWDSAQDIYSRTIAAGGSVVTLGDDQYPEAIFRMSNPPFVLYYRGSLGGISRRSIALVGTTEPSQIGSELAYQYGAEAISRNIQVVSGLAKGIDTAALRGALDAGGNAYAVVGHGIDFEYPKQNHDLYERIARHGAVISHFPTGMGPQRWTFPLRNEVMCAMGSATVIIEAHEKCGSLIQAEFSFKHKRQVMIATQPLQGQHPEWLSTLIRKGGRPVTDFNDVVSVVLDDIVPSTRQQPRQRAQHQMALWDDATTGLHSDAPQCSGILFDLDGVLVDSRPALRQAYHETILQYGGTPDEEWIETNLTESPAKVLTQHRLQWSDVRGSYWRNLVAARKASPGMIEGIEEFVVHIHDSNIPMGVVTSLPDAQAHAALGGLARYFKCVITYEMVKAVKPAPNGLLKASELLGIQPESSLFIGDTHKDLLAARSAKMQGVAVLWGLESEADLKRYSPDYLVASPAELLSVVESARVEGCTPAQ